MLDRVLPVLEPADSHHLSENHLSIYVVDRNILTLELHAFICRS
jgi:hypothetical protein